MSEPNYDTTKWFSEDLLAIKMKKIKVKMNKPVYLSLSILEISETLMHEFWYDYIKPNYQNNANVCIWEMKLFARCSLLVTFCLLLVTFCLLLVAFYSLLDKKF